MSTSLERAVQRQRDRARAPRLGPLVLQATVAVVLAVAGAVGLYLFLAWLLGVTPRPEQPTSDQQNLLADLVKIALGLAAGIGAAVALTIGYRRARVEEAASHRDDQRLFSSRYQEAAELIGHNKAAVRLAGLYAMARLADDWEEQRQQCIDVLCAYLRLPYIPAASEPGEQEVRRTVIRLITAHLQPTAELRWRWYRFDFNGAFFDGGDFRGAEFLGLVDFRGAVFYSGYVDFGNTKFSAGAFRFDAAVFNDGAVDFRGAEFSGGTVNFVATKFSGGAVDFRDAEFSGGTVRFDGAMFTGGEVDLSNAVLGSGGTPPRGLPEAPPAGLKLPDWLTPNSSNGPPPPDH